MYASRGSRGALLGLGVPLLGEPGLDTGADLDDGLSACVRPLPPCEDDDSTGRERGVPHISHSRRYGWLRNVHTEQGTELGFRRPFVFGLDAPSSFARLDGEPEDGAGAGVFAEDRECRCA